MDFLESVTRRLLQKVVVEIVEMKSDPCNHDIRKNYHHHCCQIQPDDSNWDGVVGTAPPPELPWEALVFPGVTFCWPLLC